jgi:hypothetical protein
MSPVVDMTWRGFLKFWAFSLYRMRQYRKGFTAKAAVCYSFSPSCPGVFVAIILNRIVKSFRDFAPSRHCVNNFFRQDR